MIEPVRPISSDDIEQARNRIAGTVLRTPLVKLSKSVDELLRELTILDKAKEWAGP